MRCALVLIGILTLRAIAADTSGLLVGPFVAGTANYDLVPDGDFESGFRPPWINYVNDHIGQFVDSTDQAYLGTHSAKAVPAMGFTGYGFAEYQFQNLVAGQQYVISAFFLRPDAPALYIDMFDIPNDPEPRPAINPNEWQFAWQTFTAPSSSLAIRLVFDGGSDTGPVTTSDTGYIDEVALTPLADFVAPQVAPDLGSTATLTLLAFGGLLAMRQKFAR